MSNTLLNDEELQGHLRIKLWHEFSIYYGDEGKKNIELFDKFAKFLVPIFREQQQAYADYIIGTPEEWSLPEVAEMVIEQQRKKNRSES